MKVQKIDYDRFSLEAESSELAVVLLALIFFAKFPVGTIRQEQARAGEIFKTISSAFAEGEKRENSKAEDAQAVIEE
jgi:hypothetical protein